MNIILGIDTGGTYTDTVLVHGETKEILYKAKTLTTKQKLRNCIETSFAGIPSHMILDISMVCLSTTLATNAIVEGHGCKEGLILIGGRPEGKMPCNRVSVVKGKYDIKGRLKENMDSAEVMQVVESFRGKVDAIAISGYASVRNPKHELYVKKIIEHKLKIPVVCAHELTSTLGFYERTITADLNAKLIPMVCELMDAVKIVMDRYNIQAPLMIVKGNGNLMTDVCARSKPIETILSGPAASVVGGIHLSGKQDAFVLDIGGTTTDIANVSNGKLNIRNEGAKVGGWFTHVRAAEVFTIGLGGDSWIYLDSEHNIKIGPQKSIPLSMAGEKYPELIKEIGEIYVSNAYKHFCYQDETAYQLVKKYDKLSYSDEESVIIEVLRYTPHTLHYLERNARVKNLRSVLDELLREGVIARISLTPTDILHVTGQYQKWNSVIAEMGLKIAAAQSGKSEEEFIKEVSLLILEKIDCACIRAAMYFDQQEINVEEDEMADYFLNRLYFGKQSSVLKAEYHLNKTLVAIGAPSGVWAANAGKRLHTDVIIPEHAEVANAVGAAVGRAVENVEILIRQDSISNTFIVYSSLNRTCFDTLLEATDYAVRVGEECIERLSEKRNYKLKVDQEDVCIEESCSGREIFIERIVTLSASFESESN